MPNKKFKIITAMSGGVDSSIATALLKKQGHDVVGVFMKFWTPQERGKSRENLCCSAEAKADARAIAGKLGIPFYVMDVRKEFKSKVVNPLIEEYKKGNTPNPCVECNKHIKFGFLMKKMLELKADYIATGHYARIKFVNSKQIRYSLMTAKDKTKDQTYFLWTLKQAQLRRILFPIGDYTKREVKAMAKKWDLPVFEKKESQEICFIPDADITKFLKKRIGVKNGPIITTKGEKMGQHQGLAYYTIGQRKGIKIGGIGPFYVVNKDFKKNALIVAQGDFDDALFKKEFIISKTNWISSVKFPLRCKVKIRYLTEAVSCTIYEIRTTKYQIRFTAPQRAVTPGQSAVFYKGNQVLGGGIIC